MALPERTNRPERVVVVGAGLTGLTAAYRVLRRARAERRAVEVVVFEARDRVGGTVGTDAFDGFIVESGPDSFSTEKPWALDLCHELGLGDELVDTAPQYRRSFVSRNGRLLPVPEGFVLMGPSRLMPLLTTNVLSFKGKLRVLLDLLLPRRDAEGPEETLASFAKRRLGREAYERLVEPLVSSRYTADPNELSLRATLPRYLEMEAEHGGLIRGAMAHSRLARSDGGAATGARYGASMTLAGGMQTLPNALAAALPPGSVRTGVAVRRVSRSGSTPGWLVELLDGPPVEADVLVLATEAHASARLLDGVDSSLALHLRSIPYASSAVVNLAYRRDQVAHPLDGFGLVVPAVERRAVLAASFSSVKFPNRAPAGTVLLRAFLGGPTFPDLLGRDDEALKTIVRSELYDLLGVRGDALFADVRRHPRAMPQYTLGHLDRVAAVERLVNRHPRLIVAGTALDGVGIPDVVRAGGRAAEQVMAELQAGAKTAAA